MTTQLTTSFSFPFQVANLNGKLTATQTTLTTSDQELRQKETEVGKGGTHCWEALAIILFHLYHTTT